MLLLCMALMHSLFSVAWGWVAIRLAPLGPSFWYEAFHTGYLPAGPFGVLGALVCLYYRITPPLWTISVYGTELTDRILVSVPLGLLALSQPPYSCISVVLGMLASQLYSLDAAFQVPARFASLLQRASAPWIGSHPVPMRGSEAQYHRI